MKNKSTLIKLGFATITLALIFSSCSKERIESEKEDGPSYSSADDFFNENKQEEQEFTVDSLGQGPIVGKMGTKLWGDKTIFMYKNGQDINYPFTLKLVEIYPVKDIILYPLPTLANNNILESRGEIRIRAFKGTEELVLKPGKKYYMELANDSNLINNMSVYYGSGSGASINWTNNVSSLDASINPDTLSAVINSTSNYGMAIARMGWVNCARLHNPAGATSTIKFSVEGSNPENIAIFIVLKNIPRSVMKVTQLESKTIPIGTEATVVAIARNQDGVLVLDKQNITVANNQIIQLNPSTISETNLLAALSAS